MISMTLVLTLLRLKFLPNLSNFFRIFLSYLYTQHEPKNTFHNYMFCDFFFQKCKNISANSNILKILKIKDKLDII